MSSYNIFFSLQAKDNNGGEPEVQLDDECAKVFAMDTPVQTIFDFRDGNELPLKPKYDEKDFQCKSIREFSVVMLNLPQCRLGRAYTHWDNLQSIFCPVLSSTYERTHFPHPNFAIKNILAKVTFKRRIQLRLYIIESGQVSRFKALKFELLFS